MGNSLYPPDSFDSSDLDDFSSDAPSNNDIWIFNSTSGLWEPGPNTGLDHYMGVYNATTNTPTLINGTGNNGDYHRVNVGGTQDFGAGSIVFDVGDLVLYDGATDLWEKVDGNPDLVVSVAGKQGAVTLDMDDLSETATGKVLTADERKAIVAVGLISGVLTGGEVTVNGGDSAKIDLAAGTGIIVDWSTPGTPLFIPVSWIQQLAITVTNLATDGFTSLYIDSAGLLQQVGGALITPQQRRQNVVVDTLVHPDNATVSLISPLGVLAYQGSNALFDYVAALGAVNTGNGMSANATDLAVQKAAGTTTLPWINRGADPQNPSRKTNPVQAPLSAWGYSHRDGSGGFTNLTGITAVDPDQFDDGTGTLTAVANNKFTIQRFFFFGQGITSVSTYGQVEYNSLAEAETSIFSENPIIDPVSSIASFVTALIVKKGTTDLSNAADAKFIDIISQATSAAAGAGAQDLQSTYNLSVTPEIETDSTRGALSLKRGSALDSDDMLEILNAASGKVWSVTAEGNVTLSGTINGEDITLIASDVSDNNGHVAGDGSDHGDVALNTSHAAGTGADHTDVATNNAKVSNVTTNLTTTQTATTVTVLSSDGTNALLPQAIAGGNAGMMSGADKTRIDATTNTNSGDEPDADLTTKGIIEIATVAETDTGTDATRAVSPAGLATLQSDIDKNKKSGLSFVISGAGAVITTGVKGDIEMPFAGTIDSVRLFADQVGSIVIDIFKDTFVNFPPLVGDSITASAKPTISSGVKDEDSTLTGWTTSFAKGDILRFNVDSVTTIERVTVSLNVTKT